MAYDLTAIGRTKLENELADLRGEYEKTVKRVAEARAQGDLSENAEYENAREEQRNTQARIEEIENILENAKLIRKTTKDSVALGVTVVLDDKTEYEIVGPLEAAPLDGKISNESPIGKALMGKKVGETAEIKTPKGKKVLKIKKLV